MKLSFDGTPMKTRLLYAAVAPILTRVSKHAQSGCPLWIDLACIAFYPAPEQTTPGRSFEQAAQHFGDTRSTALPQLLDNSTRFAFRHMKMPPLQEARRTCSRPDQGRTARRKSRPYAQQKRVSSPRLQFPQPDKPSSAWRRSSIRSSTSSRPTERRTRPSVMPTRRRSSTGISA